MNERYFVRFTIFHLLFATVSCHQFSSTIEIKKLLDNEKTVLDSLFNYMDRQETNGQPVEANIKTVIQLLRDENNRSSTILPVANPVTVYHVLSRASRDWARLRESLACEEHNACPFLTGADVIDVVSKRERIRWPERHDVIQAAHAILNVWNVYDLDLATLASGTLGMGLSEPLSADDIFFIGNTARDSGKLFEAITWLQYLVDHWSTFKDPDIKYTTLVRKLAMALKENGMKSRAIELLQNASDDEPDDIGLTRDLNYLQTTTYSGDDATDLRRFNELDNDVTLQEEHHFENLCRSSLNRAWPITPRELHCHRIRLRNSYGFSKIELLSWTPRVELIYEVINKGEADAILSHSDKLFKPRNTIVDTAYGFVDERHISTAMCEWNKAMPALLANVTRRLEMATHLHLRHAHLVPSSDCYSISNIGPGVPTWPRTDYFEKEMTQHTHTGNRLATIMIQLNDVLHGGQLVFPRLNITITTIQGSAVIWENLRRNGEPCQRSKHQTCPSVVGPHWALSKNVFYSNQMFRRRCMPYKNMLFT